jgi:hypothetical protein
MKLIAVLFCVFAMSSGVLCQTDSKIEIFGGYSYLRANDPLESVDFNGWNASANYNFNRWLGLKADFSGHYRPALDVNRHAFLFGPSFRLSPPDSRISLFSHALVGAVRSGGFPGTPQGTFIGTAFGGGLDFGMNKALSLRLLQADYLGYRTHVNFPLCILPPPAACSAQTSWTNNFRASTGIVFRFGKAGQ